MKFTTLALITAAVAGVSAAPVESGPLISLQDRAADAIGGFMNSFRRDQAREPAAPALAQRDSASSPVRFHNARDFVNHEKRDGDLVARKGASKSGNVPPLAPFAASGKRDAEEEEEEEEEVVDLARRKSSKVPPLAPFAKGQ